MSQGVQGGLKSLQLERDGRVAVLLAQVPVDTGPPRCVLPLLAQHIEKGLQNTAGCEIVEQDRLVEKNALETRRSSCGCELMDQQSAVCRPRTVHRR